MSFLSGSSTSVSVPVEQQLLEYYTHNDMLALPVQGRAAEYLGLSRKAAGCSFDWRCQRGLQHIDFAHKSTHI